MSGRRHQPLDEETGSRPLESISFHGRLHDRERGLTANHLHKFGASYCQEWHLGFRSHRFCQQGLAAAWWPKQEGPSGHFGTQLEEALRTLEAKGRDGAENARETRRSSLSHRGSRRLKGFCSRSRLKASRDEQRRFPQPFPVLGLPASRGKSSLLPSGNPQTP